MPAFAVKHKVEDYGPLANIMKDVRKAPYSYTSNEPEASEAAFGNYIYVLEVRVETKNVRSYWLGYKFRAYEKHSPAGGGLWRERFKFKNAARPGTRAEGSYLDVPVRITDPGLDAWLREKSPAMVAIPSHLIPALEALITNPVNNAKSFT